MNKVDKLVFKVYGNNPCLSPSRYESFYLLTKLIKEKSWGKVKILEIGCGSGIYAKLFDNLLDQGQYTGIDLEFKGNINQRKEGLKRIKANFRIMDARKLVFKNNAFDLVLSFTSLEHIKEDEQVLQQIHRILAKGGTFFLIIPSIFTFPFQLGRHGYHYYTKKNLLNKFRKMGFKIEGIYSFGGLAGFFFSLLQNWLDLLVLLPFGLYYLIFYPQKLKGNSRRDMGGGLAKKILSRTTYVYRKFLIGRKIHFNLLKLVKLIDDNFPIFPTGYFLVAEK